MDNVLLGEGLVRQQILPVLGLPIQFLYLVSNGKGSTSVVSSRALHGGRKVRATLPLLEASSIKKS
eukprot:1158507-Pelagomonas_calceolata.AAC.11